MNLVYDRTAQDVETARAQRGTALTPLKGCYNVSDLNRVESAVKTLAAALTSAGYPVEVTPVLKGKSRLPSGYTEVEWIQSSGSQYIDSGVTETSDMAVSCHFDVDTVASDYLFGSQQNGSNLSYNGIYKNNMLEYNYNEIGFTAASSIELAEEVVGSTNSITINGVSHTASTGTPQNVSMLIFGIRRNTDAMRPYGGQAKLRYFKIKKGSNTVRDFVPCKNPSGTVGLYDLVSGEFYTTPTATGAVALPAGYTQVEYLQSSGTQYIDIGFKPNQDTRIVIDFTTLTTSANAYAYGMRGDSAHNINPRFGAIFKNASVRVDYGNDNGVTLPLTLTAGGRYKLDQNKNTCALNASTATNSTATFQCPNSAYLFAINEGGTAKYFATIKLYSGQVYDNGTLIRNFVPARNAAGTLGLYDTVNEVFYTNKGSGAFTAGADIVGFTAGADVSPYEDREWQEGDVLYRPQWVTYLSNVQKLRDAYYTLAETGELPAPEDKLGYVGANTIEKILADIDLLIDCMKASYRRCGTFRAGNNAAHLPLKGSV